MSLKSIVFSIVLLSALALVLSIIGLSAFFLNLSFLGTRIFDLVHQIADELIEEIQSPVVFSSNHDPFPSLLPWGHMFDLMDGQTMSLLMMALGP